MLRVSAGRSATKAKAANLRPLAHLALRLALRLGLGLGSGTEVLAWRCWPVLCALFWSLFTVSA